MKQESSILLPEVLSPDSSTNLHGSNVESALLRLPRPFVQTFGFLDISGVPFLHCEAFVKPN